MSEQTQPKPLLDLGLNPGLAIDDSHRVIKNAYWYDQFAHLVSGGDIAFGQLEVAAERMDDGQSLTILPSYVGTMRRPSRVDKMLNRTIDDPGMRFVTRNFAILIMPQCVFFGPNAGRGVDNELATPHEIISTAEARKLMNYAQDLAPSRNVFSLYSSNYKALTSK
jgi:hypothetical protein